jgi:bifunctional non-homologous end joining protein LigD
MQSLFGRRGSPDAFLYAFDLLELDGRDLRNESRARRRSTLVQLLAEAQPGIRLCEHIEDTNGAVVFRAACNMGLEGIVAKRCDSRYHSGRSRDWIKIRNRTSDVDCSQQAGGRPALICVSLEPKERSPKP